MDIPELPLIKISLTCMILVVVVLGSLINIVEKKLPIYCVKLFRYGKFAYKGPEDKKSKLPVIEVPKRWFKHFYLFSAVLSTYVTWIAFSVYCRGMPVPDYFNTILDILYTKQRSATAPAGYVLVALMLLSLQSYRRLYETFFVCVYSDGKINLGQYLCGFIHYLAAITCTVAEAPKFTTDNQSNKELEDGNLTLGTVLAVGVFLWAFVHQYRSAVILADLRKNKEGKVVTTKHKIPTGDLFNVVSSPHLLCEILMYLALSVLLWNNTAWRFVLVWVVSNQFETALLSHWWYKETFKKEYPKNRKAIIPFIY